MLRDSRCRLARGIAFGLRPGRVTVKLQKPASRVCGFPRQFAVGRSVPQRAVGISRLFNSIERRPNFGALLVHSSLQMRASDANDSVLSYSEQMKRGVYEQGRKNFF